MNLDTGVTVVGIAKISEEDIVEETMDEETEVVDEVEFSEE